MKPQFTAAKFAPVMAMLYAASGAGRQPDKYTVEVYFDLLNDLPLEAVQIAAKRAVAESQYPTLPPAGVLRRFACEAMEVDSGSAADALGMIRRAVRIYGYMRGSEALASLPGDIAAVAEAIGWDAICDSENPEALRAHFLKLWNEHMLRETTKRRLPASVREGHKKLQVSEEAKRLAGHFRISESPGDKS